MVTVFPIYPNETSRSKKRSEYEGCGYRAFLLPKRTAQGRHKQLAGGSIESTVAEALQSLLVNIGSNLTNGGSVGDYMSRANNQHCNNPFSEQDGFVDSDEVQKGRRGRSQERTAKMQRT